MTIKNLTLRVSPELAQRPLPTRSQFMDAVDAASLGSSILDESSTLFHAIVNEVESLAQSSPAYKFVLAHIRNLAEIGVRAADECTSSLEEKIEQFNAIAGSVDHG